MARIGSRTSGSGGGSGGSSSALTRTAVKTGAYTAAVSQLVPVDTTGGAVTITLPTAPLDGSTVAVKQILGTAGVTVALAGGDVINRTGGATSLTMYLLGEGITLQYTAAGAIWTIVSRDTAPSQLALARTSTQTGTAYTTALTDAGTTVEFTNAAAVVATIPPNSSVAYAVGTVLGLYAGGAGGLTVAAGAGVTIRNNVAPLTQYGEVSLRQRAVDEWVRLG